MSRAREIEERAARWLIRREERSWSASEETEFQEWLGQSDAHKAAFWRLECGWSAADRIASLGAQPQVHQRGFSRRSAWAPLAAAASLLLAVTAFLQWPNLPFGGSQGSSRVEFETPIGGHEIVALPDGSRVELNTDTELETSVDERGRTVWMGAGEAFFEVAKRAGQEFVIHAGPRTITVLGTKFSVRRSAREIVVAVLEGKVRVDGPEGAADGDATLAAGNLAIVTAKRTVVTNSAAAVQQQLAWRTGQLVFDETPLAAAAEQFNRYNAKPLLIAHADVARLRVSGSFRARDVGAFARMLERSFGLKVEEEPARTLVSLGRIGSREQLKQTVQGVSLPPAKVVIEDKANACREGDTECGAPAAAAPAAAPAVQAAAPPVKAARDARNWAVLHKLYPPRALAAREEGLVAFLVRIDGGGNPTSCKITHTSGHPLLDLETCKLIMVHATFKPPADATRSQQRTYEGVVNWKLPTTALSAVPAAPTPVAQAAAPDEIICKMTPRTGSNVAKDRTCMSKRDWQRASDEVKEPWKRERHN